METLRSTASAAVTFGLWGLSVFVAATTSALAQTRDLRGEVVDEQNKPIAGAMCTLSGRMLPAEGLPEQTTAKGEFHFSGLVAGAYSLTCAAEGYRPISQADLQVTASASPVVQMVLPREVTLKQRVEVREKAPTLVQQGAAPPVTINAAHLQTLPLPLVEEKFRAALPVVPGVIRTPDGKINFKGEAETQSLLLVDSAQTVDPVTGSFAIDVPTIAIESINVNTSTLRAEYGGSSGGLTRIETRPPSNEWHFEAQDVTPNPRIKGGSLVGIADFNPQIYLTGPFLKDKLNFSEALEYDVDKQPVRGLPFPHNEIKTRDWNSFSSLQLILSPRHLVAANVNIFPLRRQFANISSLVPQTASSDYRQHGFSVGINDHYALRSGAVLTTLVQATKFDSKAQGQGPKDMLVTPDGWSGNFFNTYDRASNLEELRETFEPSTQDWYGKHHMTFGGNFLHRSYRGTTESRPVVLTRANGSVAERIDFSGAGSLDAANSEAALFAQDHWTFTDRLTVEAGGRYTGQSLGEWTDVAPRLGVAYALGRDGRTVLRSGVAVFNDRVPLLAGDFTANPTRTVTLFDEHGVPLGPPVAFVNEYLRVNEGGHVTRPSADHLNSTPLNVTWNVEADRQLRSNLQLRVKYLWSQTYDEFIVDPRHQPGSAPALVLTNTGGAHYREFESTLHARPTERSELNISYVRSLAHGDLNSLAQVYVPFEQPVIRPNFFGALASDIPHRLIAWGQFETHFWGIFAGPLVDYHSGFPYSTVDTLQNYVDPPNTHRFPRFFSLDLKLGKEFHLPLPWVRKYKFRGALTTFNLTNNANPRDVFNSIASPNFGHYLGFQHRFFDTNLAVIY